MALLLGCAGVKVIDPVVDGGLGMSPAVDAGCLDTEPLDAAAIEAGRAFLLGGDVGGAFVPRMAWDNLYLVWGTGRPADLAAAARARYGVRADIDSERWSADGPHGLGRLGSRRLSGLPRGSGCG